MVWMLSPTLREVHPAGSDRGLVVAFYCPACKCAHKIELEKPNVCDAMWSWDGNAERPTFSPSLNCWPNNDKHRCHSWIRAGRIEFLADCGHAMAGTTVDIPDWPRVLD